MIERKQLYIGGRWVAPSSSQTLEVTASNTGEVWATIPAGTAADADEWTRALVEEVKLRTALHGYETSVRFLRDQEWPQDAVSRAVLDHSAAPT